MEYKPNNYKRKENTSNKNKRDGSKNRTTKPKNNIMKDVTIKNDAVLEEKKTKYKTNSDVSERKNLNEKNDSNILESIAAKDTTKSKKIEEKVVHYKNSLLGNGFFNNKRNIYLSIIICVVVIAIIVGLLFLFNHNKKVPDDGLTYNKNRSFSKVQKINGITFKNIECSYDGKDSIIRYVMVNQTKKTIYLKNYEVLVKDKNNLVLTKIVANITQEIKPDEEVPMSNQVVGVDLTGAYYMELIVNTEKKNK